MSDRHYLLSHDNFLSWSRLSMATMVDKGLARALDPGLQVPTADEAALHLSRVKVWQARQETLEREASMASLTSIPAPIPFHTGTAARGRSPPAPSSPRAPPGIGAVPPPDPRGEDQRDEEVDPDLLRSSRAPSESAAADDQGRASQDLADRASRARTAAYEHSLLRPVLPATCRRADQHEGIKTCCSSW